MSLLERHARRAAWVALFAAGIIGAAFGSTVLDLASAPMPLWFFPDGRLAFLGAAALAVGALAAWGPRRQPALWFAVVTLVALSLDATSIRWFSSEPGTLAGTRAPVVRLAASIGALAALLALEAEVAAARFARDLERRGLPSAEAAPAGALLARAGRARVGLAAGGVAVLGGVALVAERLIGDKAPMSAEVGLLVGLVAAGALAMALASRHARALGLR
ncbi:MAG TPA: hypothetical protein VM889_14300 [Candidatus Thermoplasmatota archaeon]|nr:hypothetical protein [Candidatus Thermoplasmatota archaeon]